MVSGNACRRIGRSGTSGVSMPRPKKGAHPRNLVRLGSYPTIATPKALWSEDMIRSRQLKHRGGHRLQDHLRPGQQMDAARRQVWPTFSQSKGDEAHCLLQILSRRVWKLVQHGSLDIFGVLDTGSGCSALQRFPSCLSRVIIHIFHLSHFYFRTMSWRGAHRDDVGRRRARGDGVRQRIGGVAVSPTSGSH